jgi:hypothetical protein
MTKLDVYYRAYKEFNKSTSSSLDIKKDLNNLKKSNVEEDLLTSTKFKCSISSDWVEAIENGLEFVEKAVNEDRQFIRTNGEIVEISKVKKISRDSIEHLAKHSNMITHVPEHEGDTLVPDKIYMVEKLSDYAIYENRFLYMLLKYLETFISYRFTKIQEIRSTYDSSFHINKEIKLDKKQLSLEIKLNEHMINNPFHLMDEESENLVTRISNCNEIIQSLLKTDLMVQVSKSPMIKPPITRTNVLKMNNNFKNALALYNYIASYKGDGFTFEEVKKEFNPFKENIANEIYSSVNLLDYVTYKIGNELDDYLEKLYQEEELRLKKEEEKKLALQIEKMRKKARENENTLLEYMLLLEKRNLQLEKDSQDLVLIKKEVIKLQDEISSLNSQIETLNKQIVDLNNEIFKKIQEINDLVAKHNEEIKQMKISHEEEINSLNKKHDEEIDKINQEHDHQIELINDEHQKEIDSINDNHQKEIDEINLDHQQELEYERNQFEIKKQEAIQESLDKISSLEESLTSKDEQIKSMNEEFENKKNEYKSSYNDLENKSNETISSLNQTNKDLESQIASLHQENELIRAELDALRVKTGVLTPSSDYKSQERFEELEHSYYVFQKFFDEQWKLTKKLLRKEMLKIKKEELKKNKK